MVSVYRQNRSCEMMPEFAETVRRIRFDSISTPRFCIGDASSTTIMRLLSSKAVWKCCPDRSQTHSFKLESVFQLEDSMPSWKMSISSSRVLCVGYWEAGGARLTSFQQISCSPSAGESQGIAMFSIACGFSTVKETEPPPSTELSITGTSTFRHLYHFRLNIFVDLITGFTDYNEFLQRNRRRRGAGLFGNREEICGLVAFPGDQTGQRARDLRRRKTVGVEPHEGRIHRFDLSHGTRSIRVAYKRTGRSWGVAASH